MPFWDKKDRPSSPVTVKPSVPEPAVTAPPIEVVKPVELPPSPEPDFSKPEVSTPFETPLALARKYFEGVKETGKLTPEMQIKIAAFTEISHLLSDGWQAEQQAAEAEKAAHHPFKKLEDTILAGVRENGAVRGSEKNIVRELAGISVNLRTKFDQEKLVSDAPDQEILAGVITSGEVFTTLDVEKLVEGYWQGAESRNSFPRTELLPMLKALGAIPATSPEGGQFPRGNENDYLIKLLQRDGKATSAEAEVPAWIGSGQTEKITEFTRPTAIDGVNVTVGFAKNQLVNFRSIANPDGYPLVRSFKLELTPEFLAKSLGIQPPETLSPEAPTQ